MRSWILYLVLLVAEEAPFGEANSIPHRQRESQVSRRATLRREESGETEESVEGDAVERLQRYGAESEDLSLIASDADEALAAHEELQLPDCLRYDEDGELYVKYFGPGTVKCVDGIPIYNYHLAYPEGEPSLLQRSSDTKDWLVTLRDPADNYDVANLTKQICDRFAESASSSCIHGHTHGNPFILEIFRTSERDVMDALSSVDTKPHVHTVEPNYVLAMHDEIDFPNAQDQPSFNTGVCASSALVNMYTGEAKPASWGIDRLDSEIGDITGLDCRSRDNDGDWKGKGVNIWILDTGIRPTHEEFEGRAEAVFDATLVECDEETGECGSLVICHNSSDSTCGIDKNGHGTHCAATAAGKGFGVAREANILSGKVLGDQKDGSIAWIIMGIDFVINNYTESGMPPTVVSLSLGGKGNSPAIKQSVDKMIDAGIVVTVAAGNFAEDACAYNPAFVPRAITVGATNPEDVFADYSNYGSCVDILAPGSFIVSAAPTSDTDKKPQSGTSMACPHVAGAAAILLSQKPELHIKNSMATSVKILHELLDMALEGKVMRKGTTSVDAAVESADQAQKAHSLKNGTPNKLLNIRALVGPTEQKDLRYLAMSVLLGSCCCCWTLCFVSCRAWQKSKKAEAINKKKDDNDAVFGHTDTEKVRKGKKDTEKNASEDSAKEDGKDAPTMGKTESKATMGKTESKAATKTVINPPTQIQEHTSWKETDFEWSADELANKLAQGDPAGKEQLVKQLWEAKENVMPGEEPVVEKAHLQLKLKDGSAVELILDMKVSVDEGERYQLNITGTSTKKGSDGKKTVEKKGADEKKKEKKKGADEKKEEKKGEDEKKKEKKKGADEKKEEKKEEKKGEDEESEDEEKKEEKKD